MRKSKTASALSRNRDVFVAAAVIVASLLLALADRDPLAHFALNPLVQTVVDEWRRLLTFFLS